MTFIGVDLPRSTHCSYCCLIKSVWCCYIPLTVIERHKTSFRWQINNDSTRLKAPLLWITISYLTNFSKLKTLIDMLGLSRSRAYQTFNRQPYVVDFVEFFGVSNLIRESRTFGVTLPWRTTSKFRIPHFSSLSKVWMLFFFLRIISGKHMKFTLVSFSQKRIRLSALGCSHTQTN